MSRFEVYVLVANRGRLGHDPVDATRWPSKVSKALLDARVLSTTPPSRSRGGLAQHRRQSRSQTFSACGNLFPLFPTVAGWAHLPKPACGRWIWKVPLLVNPQRVVIRETLCTRLVFFFLVSIRVHGRWRWRRRRVGARRTQVRARCSACCACRSSRERQAATWACSASLRRSGRGRLL